MPKPILYALAAVADFVAAYVFYATGRVVVPIVLTLAGLCFVAAMVGALVRKRDA